jgi:hypothetical protein
MGAWPIGGWESARAGGSGLGAAYAAAKFVGCAEPIIIVAGKSTGRSLGSVKPGLQD